MRDRIEGVLSIAREVIDEHGDEHGWTRIERLARWIIHNVGWSVTEERAGSVSRLHLGPAMNGDTLSVIRASSFIGVETIGSTEERESRTIVVSSPEQARDLAAALYRAADQAEFD